MQRTAGPLLLVLLARLLLCPAAAAEPSRGEDKVLHVLFGASCALLVSAVAAPALKELPLSDSRYALGVSAAGLGAAFCAGITKELLDFAGLGNPEWLDLLATAAGGFAASMAVFAGSRADREARLCPVYASFGIALMIPPAADLFRRLSSRKSSASAE